MALELEIKLRVGGPGDLQERLDRTAAQLREIGAALVHPRELEDNLAFDFPDRSVVQRGCLLRVRVVPRGALLTWKGPVRPLAGGEAQGLKAREESEVMLPSSESRALLEILKGLGMEPVFRYQKYRATWDWNGLHVMIDETPIGLFLELEGKRTSIDEGARALGYSTPDFITSSYRDLYLQHVDQARQGSCTPLPVDRMVFDS